MIKRNTICVSILALQCSISGKKNKKLNSDSPKKVHSVRSYPAENICLKRALDVSGVVSLQTAFDTESGKPLKGACVAILFCLHTILITDVLLLKDRRRK